MNDLNEMEKNMMRMRNGTGAVNIALAATYGGDSNVGELCDSLAATYGGLESGGESASCITGEIGQLPSVIGGKVPSPVKRGRGRPKKPESVPWRNFTETKQGVAIWICTGGKGRIAVTWDDIDRLCEDCPKYGNWSRDSILGLVLLLAGQSALLPTKPCKTMDAVYAFIKEAMAYGAKLYKSGHGQSVNCAAEYIMGRRYCE